MKQMLIAALCLGVTTTMTAQGTTGAAAPKTPQASSATMDRASMEQAIIANEQKLNEAVAKGSVTAFKALVADSGWSVDAGGATSVLDFEKNFAQMKIEPGWTITDSRIVWSDTNTAVHIYKWTGKGTYMGQPVPPVVYASTIWNKRQGKWIAVFHQETAVAAK